MKKSNIFAFILGCLVFIIISSTTIPTTTNTVVQPAKPTTVFCDWYTYSTSMTSDIQKYHKLGYIVKSITANSQKSEYILVMEKY